MASQPSNAIASRSLKLTRPVNGCERIEVRIYRPNLDESGMWSCAYEIVFPDGRKRHAGKGADSWQALTSAIAFCEASVLASDFASSGQIDWEGDPFEWPREVC